MSRHRATDTTISIMVILATTALGGCVLDSESGDELLPTSSAAECEPRDHDLGNGIVLRACDDQLIDADEATMILEATAAGHTLPEQDITAPPSALLGARFPVDCRWYQLDATGRAAMLACPQGRHVVAGGCATTKLLNASSPWENIGNDPPDNGELWDNVGATNGWLCEQAEFPIIPTRLIASALCCVPQDESDTSDDTKGIQP
jgi:hypothetical protein